MIQSSHFREADYLPFYACSNYKRSDHETEIRPASKLVECLAASEIWKENAVRVELSAKRGPDRSTVRATGGALSDKEKDLICALEKALRPHFDVRP